MKKILNIILIISIVMTYFIPINMISVKAASTYKVSFITTSGKQTAIETYTNITSAISKANTVAGSSVNNVPIVYKDSALVYVKYGIARLKGTSTINIYKNANLTTKLTYTHPSYGQDALFIDYNETYDTYKIKLSGVTGYIKRSQATLYPSSNSTTTKTYYINEPNSTYGNQLIHYINPGSTILGPSPLFLKANTKYYSYDGIYYYTSIVNEVLDARENKRTRAINKKPYYNYYMYLPSRTKTTYSAANLNSYIGYSGKIDKKKYTANPYAPSLNWIQVTATTPITVRKGPGTSYAQISSYQATNGAIYELLDKGKEVTANGYKWYKIQYNSATVGYIASNPTTPWVKTYTPSSSTGKFVCPSSFPSNQSMLYNEGSNLISSQTKYGINATQTLALAINESGWGRSCISVSTNNIFGHGAFDSDPDGNAYSYSSVGASINYHAYGFMASNYNNPINGGSYNGTHYGNKGSGNNIDYASDPYWGEKMATFYYRIDRYINGSEFKNSNIGVKTGSGAVPVYSDPEATSVYYNLKAFPNIPVVILDTVTGKEIGGNNKWYKIQSDVPIDANRKVITGKTQSTYSYNYNTSYAYIHSSYIYVEEEKPVIAATNQTINKGSSFDPKKNVTAYDAWDGNLTSKIVIKSNNVDVNKTGTYTIVYNVTDSDKNVGTKTISVQVVTSATSNMPAINGTGNITIAKGEKLNLLSNVTATDFEDGDLTNKLVVTPDNIDTNVVGKTTVKYSVTDSDKNTATKSIAVTVEEEKNINYTKKTGSFGFESLKYNQTTNKINIKGYLTINEINNKLATDIRYDLVLTNEQTNKVYTKSLARWTSSSQWPYKVPSTAKYDYTYSWFNGDVDLSDIPQGDYKLSVRARSGTYESTALFRNIFFKPMENKITTKTGRGYQFKTNYFSNSVPLLLHIRDEGTLSKKNTPTVDNMINSVYQIELQNNKLNIFSTSYNVKGDYSTSKNIKRQVILENVNTFERYNTEVGYTDKGAYTVSMAVPDGLSKKRAWYDANIDLSKMPIGTYAIYIRTQANVDDHGELYDIFNKTINSTMKIGDKTYSLKRNDSKRYRIELTVK